ncbi:MAG: flagellar motor protein [Desulfobacterales bacterium]|nr:flagellar motor protein [Desulfobacterales bacterium]
MDRASVMGIIFGITAIVGGNLFEGGSLHSIMQLTAAVIVFGGTFGAVLLSFPLRDILKAISSLRDIFVDGKTNPETSIKSIIQYSNIVRRNGLIALEPEISKINDSFLRKALRLAVDGMGPKILKEAMEQENITYEEERRRIARVFETAGGFAPTIGILGAVLGLIQVMENLSDPSKLGSGIAVAFVATIYGVGSANLILLPISKKLLNRLNHELSVREIVLEGVVGIQSGINPYYLEERLRVFIEGIE